MKLCIINLNTLTVITLCISVITSMAQMQTSDGFNPWWTCPDCGAQYRTEDYKRHRATAHANRNTPETTQPFSYEHDSPPMPVIRVIHEPAIQPRQQELTVTYTPFPESTNNDE